MPDERCPGIFLEDRREDFRKPRTPGPFVREVIHFLEVNQNRHVQVGGECIHAAQLRTTGGDVEFHLAEALCSILHGLREHLFGVGLRHVVAVEPGEPARCCGLKRLHLVEDAPARE